jgi:peptide/nickel transport system substrate-binding protein
MNLKKISMLCLIIFLVVFAGLTACKGGSGKESAASQASRGEKIITMASTSAWNTIYPFAQGSGITDTIWTTLLDTLVYYNEKNEPMPRLASSWDVSGDGKVYTLHIAKNAAWSDGTPVTADDYIFSVDLHTDPKIPNPGRTKTQFFIGTDDAGARTGTMDRVGVRRIDDKTVECTLKLPIGDTMFFAYQPNIFPYHLLKDADRENLQADPYWIKPVCSGPFIYDSVVTSSTIEMVKNPAYHLGLPNFDRLIIKIYNAASLLPGLMNGEIDVLIGNSAGSLPISDYEMAVEQKNLQVTPINSGSILHMPINLTKEYLQSPKIRQAFDMAVNRQRIVDVVLGGLGDVVSSPYNANTLNYVDPAIVVEYNPDKARKLLEEANWDFNRVLELCQPTGYYLREQAAILVQQDLATIGVKTQIISLDYATQMAYLSDHKLDLSFMGGSTDVKKPFFMASCFDPTVAWDWSHNQDPKYTQKLYESLSTNDLNEIKRIYREFQTMHLEAPCEVWICNEYEVNVYNKARMENVMVPPSANCPWLFWEWKVNY